MNPEHAFHFRARDLPARLGLRAAVAQRLAIFAAAISGGALVGADLCELGATLFWLALILALAAAAVALSTGRYWLNLRRIIRSAHHIHGPHLIIDDKGVSCFIGVLAEQNYIRAESGGEWRLFPWREIALIQFTRAQSGDGGGAMRLFLDAAGESAVVVPTDLFESQAPIIEACQAFYSGPVDLQ